MGKEVQLFPKKTIIMKQPNINDRLMNQTKNPHVGSFLRITESLPMITYLRRFLNMEEDLETISYTTKNYSSTNTLSSRDLKSKELDNLTDKIIPDKKGNKSLVFIQPRPGKTLGVLSDTFLEFLLLKHIPAEDDTYIQRKRDSKYYLTQGWKPSSQGNYLEHIRILKESVDREKFSGKLIQPIAHYKHNNGEHLKHTLNYFIPTVFLKHHISEGFSPMDGGRRIEIETLEKWGYITRSENIVKITEKTEQLIEEVQNLFFIEWWRSYFIHNYPQKGDIQSLRLKFNTCSQEIILRSYIDSIVCKHKLQIEIKISEISDLICISKDSLISIIKEWIVGENYGKECIQGDLFIYPPSKIDRFWANTEVMSKRFSNAMPYIPRNNKIKQLANYLESNERIILLNGEEGIGKTRFLVEYAKKNNTKWNFYWILKNQKISWNLIEKEIKSKNLVLIIDGLESFENSQEILDNYLQIELSNNSSKLIVVSSNEQTTKFFIVNHFKSRNQEIIPKITLKPLNFADLSIKNDCIRIFTKKGIKIEQSMKLIEYSQGYPDTIEHELYEYEFYINNTNPTEMISTFDQRMLTIWNSKLSQNERLILKTLSLANEIDLENPPFKRNEISEEIYKNAIKSLLKKDLVIIYHQKIHIKRIIYKKWIIKTQWVNNEGNIKDLNNLLEHWLMNHVSIFVKAINILYSRMKYLDFKNIIHSIDKWGHSTDLTINQHQIIATFYLLPYIAVKYIDNKIHMHTEPSTAKSTNNPDLISDIPTSIQKMIIRLKNNWISSSATQQLNTLIGNLHFLENNLMVIQDYQGIIEIFTNIISKIQDPSKKELENKNQILESLYLKLISYESLKNPDNFDLVLEKYQKKSHVSNKVKAFVYWLWCEEKLSKKDFKFSQIFPNLILASDLLAESNAKRDYVEFWAQILPYLQIHYKTAQNFIKKETNEKLSTIKIKLDLAQEWAKSMSLIRQYIGFILNWAIFDSNDKSEKKITTLKKLASYAINKNEFYLAGDIYHQIGMEYQNSGDYLDSVKNFELSIKWTEKSGLLVRLGDTYYHLGGVYWRLKQLDKALNMHKKAYTEYVKEAKKSDALSALNAIYDLYMVKKDTANALKTAEELQFLSSQVPKTEFYGSSLLRIIETNLLQKNYQTAKKYFEKVQNEKIDFDTDHRIHLVLLEVLICHGLNKIDCFNKILVELIQRIAEYNFVANSYEFLWLFKLLEILIGKNSTYIEKIAASLKKNPSIINNPLSIYESLLYLISNYYSADKKKETIIAECFPVFLSYFNRPEHFESPFSQMFEFDIFPSKIPTNSSLNKVLNRLENHLSEINIMDRQKFAILMIEIFSLRPYFTEEYKFTLIEANTLFSILKKTTPIYHKYEQNFNTSLKSAPKNNIILKILLDLSDFALTYNYLDLIKEILTFLNSEDKFIDREDEIQILQKWEIVNEREGNKEVALKNALKIRGLLKIQPNDSQKFQNDITIFSLKLEKELSPEIELEIIKFSQKYQDSSTREYYYALSILGFLMIRKHQFDKAEEIALTIISSCPNPKFILWFLAEYIDRIIWKEENFKTELNIHILHKFFEIFENDEDFQKIDLYATYLNALIGLIRNFLEYFKETRNFTENIKFYLRIINILKTHNSELTDQYSILFQRQMGSIIAALIDEKQLSNISEILDHIIKITKKHSLNDIYWFSLNQSIISCILTRNIKKFYDYFQELFDFYLTKKTEITGFKNSIEIADSLTEKIKKSIEITNEELQPIDVIELMIIQYLTFIYNELYQDSTQENFEKEEIIDFILYVTIIALKFKILRKGNQELLIPLWNFFLYQFPYILQNNYFISEFTNHFQIFNQKIMDMKKIDGLISWESKIIKILGLFINCYEMNYGDIIKQFEKTKNEIFVEIPPHLKQNIQNLFIIFKRSIGKGETPYQIAMYTKISLIYHQNEMLDQSKNISEISSNKIELIHAYFQIKDYPMCIKTINEAETYFKEYGYEQELLILKLYQGMIAYHQGNLKLAKKEFDFLLFYLNKMENQDGFLVFVYLFQISLLQRENVENLSQDLMKFIIKRAKELDKEKKDICFYQLMVSIYSNQNPSLIILLRKLFISRKNDIINSFTQSNDVFNQTIFEMDLSYSLFEKDLEGFYAKFQKYLDGSPQNGIKLLGNIYFTDWLKHLEVKKREKFNKFIKSKLEKWLKIPSNIKIIEEFVIKLDIDEDIQKYELTPYKDPLYLLEFCIKTFFENKK